LSPKTPLGELRERVIVNITGDKQKTINIPVLAVIRGDVEFSPPGVSFGLAEGRELIERSVKLTSRAKEPLEIKSIKSDSPAVKAVIKPIQPGKNFVVTVSLDPTKLEKELRGTVELVTNNPEQPVLRLGVFAAKKPKV
jgi:hypothetical protein